jgi:hypothetical protein
MSENTWWLCFWGMAFAAAITATSLPIYLVGLKDREMAEKGYVQKVVVITPASAWGGGADSTTIWTKPDAPTMEAATFKLEGK